jgi:hypothetical protein
MLNKKSPVQVFAEHAETTLLALMLKDNMPVSTPLDCIKAQKIVKIEKLSKAMTAIHAQVAVKATRDRKVIIQKHSDETHVRSPNFKVGDYVPAPQERYVQCAGEVEGPAPRRECGAEYVFVAENLLSKELKAAHETRQRFYQDKELNFTAELFQAAEHNDY